MDLYLGAIPSFYFYRDGQYIDRVISGSYLKLENFIDTYYIGPINLQEAIIDRSNLAISFFNEDEENSTKILAVFKCSLFDQFGHRTKDCTEKPAKTSVSLSVQIVVKCIQFGISNAWELKKIT
jgi:hypothetical protein